MLQPIYFHPWGQVHPMQKGERATHVWQHLYNLAERWDGLVGTDIRVLRYDAEQCGCPPSPDEERVRLPKVGRPCLELLERHHDRYYGPAYMRELASERTRHGRQKDNPQRLLCCTPRGLLVSVGLRPPVSVLTAFRPDLPYQDTSGRDEDYYREARQRWSIGVNMSNQGTWKEEVLQRLEEASRRPPTRVAEAWEIAWAIGQARALASSEPEVVVPLQAAEALLEHNRQKVVRLLEGNLRTEPLLAGLEASLGDEQPEEAQDRLLALEGVLVVAEVLGFEAHIQRILAEVARLASHWPSALTGFDELVRQRLGVSGQAAHEFWSTVRTATSRAPALRVPEALSTWFTRLDEARARLDRKATELLEGLDVVSATLRPTVVLGQVPAVFDVHVEGHCPPGWQLRLFIIDAEHPEGEPLREEEDYHRSAERWIFDGWRLEGEEDIALVIALAAPSLPESLPLKQLLAMAETLPDALLAEVLLSPPNERSP